MHHERARPSVHRSFIVVAALAAIAALLAARAPEPRRFTILHFNDLHGHLLPFEDVDPLVGERVRYGGFARLAGRVEQVRRENASRGRETFVLVAGDLLTGTPLCMAFRGEANARALARLGVKAFAIGNHEFDYGLARFEALRELMGERVPMISANVIRRGTGAPLAPAAVELPLGAADGASLLVVGATTPDTPVTTFPTNVAGLRFIDPREPVRAAIAERTGHGPVLVLSHLGWRDDRALAKDVPGLLCIVGAHDQVLFDEPRGASGTFVVQAYEKAKYLGRIDGVYDPRTRRAEVERVSVERITESLPELAAVRDEIARFEALLSEKMGERIGRLEEDLDGSRERVRYEETNLGNLLADIMREATEADVAILNAGSIRATILRGEVTLGDVVRAVPYPNELWRLEVPGRVLLEALTRGVRADRHDEDGGFLQVSGLRMVVEGTRVIEVTIGGRPLEPERAYRVCVPDFLRAGGDGFAMLKEVPGEPTGLPLRESLLRTIRAGGPYPPVEGRIVRR